MCKLARYERTKEQPETWKKCYHPTDANEIYFHTWAYEDLHPTGFLDIRNSQRIFKRLCDVRLRSNYKQNVARRWRMDGCVVEAWAAGYKFGWREAGRLCPTLLQRGRRCSRVNCRYLYIGMMCRRVYSFISLNAFLCPHTISGSINVYAYKSEILQSLCTWKFRSEAFNAGRMWRVVVWVMAEKGYKIMWRFKSLGTSSVDWLVGRYLLFIYHLSEMTKFCWNCI